MSNKINFRAWGGKTKRMFNNYITENPNGSLNQSVFHSSSKEYMEDDFRLMQYTGLKDKNGVEIYKGDIVKADDDEYPTFQNNAIGEVSMLKKLAIWYVDGTINDGLGDLLNCASTEVIGNIYENPELLNK